MKPVQVVVCEIGPLLIEHNQQMSAVTGSRAPSVLALLSLSRDRGCTTAELVEWCWPPQEQIPTARRSLVNVIARLRAALGTDSIETTELGYRLHGSVGSHRQQFLNLAGLAQEKLNVGETELAAEFAANALGLWRGDPWAGIDGIDGLEADRSLLHGARAQLLAVKARSSSLTGNRLEAVTIWEQALAEEPYNENWWGMLARCHLEDGRRADGLRVLQLARQSLVQVGLLPGDELVELERVLLGVDIESGSSTGGSLVSGGASSIKRGNAEPEVDLAVDRSIPFAGRSHERGSVCDFLDRSGDSRGLLISGEPGAGKTRLLVECLKERSEIHVLAGRADAESSGLLGPLADIFLENVEHLTSVQVSALGALVPGLDDGAKPANGPTRPLDHSQAAAAASSALRHLTRESQGKSVVVVDDLQWASPVVFDVLMRLLGSASSDGPLIIATHRSLPPDLSGDVAERVARLAVLPLVETLDLLPLDASDVAAIAESGGYEGDVAILHDVTGGNALFVTESVKSNEANTVPRSLQAIVQARVEKIDVNAHRYLELASLCGIVFRTDLIARALDLSDDVADRVIDALYEADVLLPMAKRKESARFTHGLVASAIAPSLGSRRRQNLQLDLAATLRADGQPVTRWVWHLVAGGSTVDVPTMVAAVRSAIDTFSSIHDYGSVIELCQQVLEHELPEKDAAAIRIELGRARMFLLGSGRVDLAEAATAARRLDDPILMAEAALAYSTGGAWSSNADEVGPALLREALEMLSSDTEHGTSGLAPKEEVVVLRARLTARLGGWRIFTASLEERDRGTAAVLETIRQSGDDVALVEALNARHIAVSCPAAISQTVAVETELESLEASGRGFSEMANSPMPGTFWRADGHRFNRGIDRRLARPGSDLDPMTSYLAAVRAYYSGDTTSARLLASRGLALKSDDVSRGNHLWINLVADWIDGEPGQSVDRVDQLYRELGGAPLRCTALWVRAAAGVGVGSLEELRKRLSPRNLVRLPELFLGGFGLGSATMAAVLMDDAELGMALVTILEPLRDQMLGVPWASYPCGAFFLGVIQATWGDKVRAGDEFLTAADIHRGMRADSFVTLAGRWTERL